MRTKKLFAGMVLAVFLLTIPQAMATIDDGEPIDFEGTYQTYDGRTSGPMTGTISEDREDLEGVMIVRDLSCPINLKKVFERGPLVWYIGTIEKLGEEFEMRILCRILPGSDSIFGTFGVSGLNFRGSFSVSA